MPFLRMNSETVSRKDTPELFTLDDLTEHEKTDKTMKRRCERAEQNKELKHANKSNDQ